MKFLIQLVIAFVRLFPQFAEILNTLKKLYQYALYNMVRYFGLIAGELENCSFLFANFKFRQNVSPCNTKQNKFKTNLILSVSESARAKLAPPAAFFCNYFFNGFFHFFSDVTFNSLITFLSGLFSGKTSIGSKICETPFSTNGTNTSIVEAGLMGLPGLDQIGTLAASPPTIPVC